MQIVRDERALWQRTSRQVLVLAPSAQDIVTLVDLPALLWDALAEPVEFDDLVEDLAVVFDRPAVEIAPDLEAAIDSLVDIRLLRRC